MRALAWGMVKLAGRIWALPNTLVGLLYGGVALLFGSRMDFAHGVIHVTRMPTWLMRSAMSLGDVHLYGIHHPPEADNSMRLGVSVGREEFLHTIQARILGPLYLPAHLMGGMISLLTPTGRCRFPMTDRWHRNNFMETGPMQGNVFRDAGKC